jgi:hypothetical protein
MFVRGDVRHGLRISQLDERGNDLGSRGHGSNFVSHPRGGVPLG